MCMSNSSVVRVRVRRHGWGAGRWVEEPGEGGRVWTGVVPLYETLGEPVPGNYNQLEKGQGYLREV